MCEVPKPQKTHISAFSWKCWTILCQISSLRACMKVCIAEEGGVSQLTAGSVAGGRSSHESAHSIFSALPCGRLGAFKALHCTGWHYQGMIPLLLTLLQVSNMIMIQTVFANSLNRYYNTKTLHNNFCMMVVCLFVAASGS